MSTVFLKFCNNFKLVVFILISIMILSAECQGQIVAADNSFLSKSITPEKAKNTALLKTYKSGVKVSSCKFIKNIETNENKCVYRALGTLGSGSRFAVVEKELYNGYEYLIIDIVNCNEYKLNGYPVYYKNKIICFNEGQTTDLQDKISFWCIGKSNKLTLTKTIPLAKPQTHERGAKNIWFSRDGKIFYYRSVSGHFYRSEIQICD